MGVGAISAGTILASAGISAGAGLGSSIAGNVMNKKAQQSANETNMQIAQMNNEWSEKMMEKQMQYNTQMNEKQFGQAKELQQIQNDYQTEMWNKTNAYNSPEAQRQRLEQAGLNPYMMMSGGSAGSATAMNGSSASAPGAGSVGLPSPSQVSVQPSRYDFSGIGSSLAAGLDMYNRLKLGDAQVQDTIQSATSRSIENQYKARQIMQTLANQIADEKNTKARTKMINTLRPLQAGQMAAATDNMIQQTQNLKETMKGVIIQNCMDYLQLQNMPTEIALKNANTAASTSFMVQQGALTRQQAINEVKKGIILDAQGTQQKVTAEYADKMAETLYQQAEATLEKTINNMGPDSPWSLFWQNAGRRPIVGYSKDGKTYTPGWFW